jgi:ubiquitin-protein ligase
MCLGMLRSDEWKPSSKIAGVLLTARNLLVEPNPDDAVETSIAELYKNDRKEFTKIAKDWTKKYAK